MIDRVCLLLEALSIVICLHHLYGKKFKPDIATVSLLAIDMIMMTTIDYFGWPSTLSVVIYPIIAVYCGIEFGFEWKKIIVNEMLCIVLIGGIQLLSSFLYYYVDNIKHFDNVDLLIIDGITLLLIIIFRPKKEIKNLLSNLLHKEKLIVIVLVICSGIIMFCILDFKRYNSLKAYEYVMLFVALILIFVLVIQFQKYKQKSIEVETELKMHELYAESFKSLVEDVRMRQHEFNNHLNTISNMHLLCDSFDELVEMQQSQCKELKKDNRYNKLLKNDNQIIRGFLYTNFLKAEKLGIKVSYELVLDKLDIKMPVYKLVEVLGDLINNAIEAMEEEEIERRLHVSIIEVEDRIEIEVRNTSKVIPRSDISQFFEKGYSQKGDNRGLGLYNVKKICDEYEFNIRCDNKVVDNLNWLTFMINYS